MFRIFLSVVGVGLIALGLFGGSPLDSFANRFNGSNDSAMATEVPAVAEGAASSIQKPTAQVITDNSPVGETKTDVADVAQQSVETPAVADSVVADPVVQPATAAQAAVETKMITKDLADDAPQTAQTAKAEGDDDTMIAVGDEVIATAADQAPVSKVVPESVVVEISDEDKATARNEEVALAKTILTSSVQADGVEVKIGKAEEVTEVSVSTAVEPPEAGVLVVLKDTINLREGPSIDHPIVLQLERGQELMEFKREGRWVHVGAYGTSGKIGWVHQRLVGSGE